MRNAARVGSRKRVKVDKSTPESVSVSTDLNTYEDLKDSTFATLEIMNKRLRAAALMNELVDLCEHTPEFGAGVLLLAKEFQRKMHFAIAADVSTEHVVVPTTAPEFWMDRKDRGETPIDFIMRVYKDWLGRGLSRPDIRKLDWRLYKVLYNGPIPPEFNDLLPTRRQTTDARLEKAGMASEEIDPQVQEAVRLHHTVKRRKSRSLG